MIVQALALLAVTVFLGVLCTRAANRQFKLARKRFKQELITATEADLAAVPVSWPYGPNTWPDPSGGTPLRRQLSLAYARTFARAATRQRITADVLNIIGVAVLAFQFGDIIHGLATSFNASDSLTPARSTAALSDGFAGVYTNFMSTAWPFLGPSFASLILITLSFGFRSWSVESERLAQLYARASRRSRQSQQRDWSGRRRPRIFRR